MADAEDDVHASLFPTREGFESTFDPKTYLDYFRELDDEDKFALGFMASALRMMPNGLLVHEFGGGPVLYSVAALAAKAREIHFSDCVQANLAEVERWLKDEQDAFDWRPHIRLALEMEGSVATPKAVAQRAAKMRRLVTRLMICDAQARAPLGDICVQYGLVAAHHCTDVAATDFAEWVQVLRNISTLIAPGGWLLVSVTTGAHLYAVSDVVFRCADLTPDQVRQGYVAAGYAPESFRMEIRVPTHEREYSGVVMAVARKLDLPET